MIAAEATGARAAPKMGRSAYGKRRIGSRYSNDTMVWLGALVAATAVLAPAQPVTVAVVDTGANVRVPEIAAKRPVTYDVRTHGRDVRDLNGHGTLVASIVARSSGDARLLIIRAGSSSGAFSDANEAAAIRYAVEHGARIVNLSLGGPRTSTVERAAIRYAISRSVLVVAAAGDDYASRPEYPAALLGSDGLAVAAVMRDGTRALFSNTGPWVSVAAPGEEGTSFAAPLVSAAAARVWTANPRLSVRQVVGLLRRTASGLGKRDDGLGYGVIDVAAAVARAEALR
jgi:subtilisin family serine protease